MRYEKRETHGMQTILLFVHFRSTVRWIQIQIEYLAIRRSFIYQCNDFRIMVNANRTFFMTNLNEIHTQDLDLNSYSVVVYLSYLDVCVCVFFSKNFLLANEMRLKHSIRDFCIIINLVFFVLQHFDTISHWAWIPIFKMLFFFSLWKLECFRCSSFNLF